MAEDNMLANTSEVSKEDKDEKIIEILTSGGAFEISDLQKGSVPEIYDENVFLVLERALCVTDPSTKKTKSEPKDGKEKTQPENEAVANIPLKRELLRILPNSMKDKVKKLLSQKEEYLINMGLPLSRRVNETTKVIRQYEIIDTKDKLLKLIKTK